MQEAKPRPPSQPVPPLSQAPARPHRQTENNSEPPGETAETAPVMTKGGLANGSSTAQPAPHPQDVAVPELTAPKPRGRQNSEANRASKAAPSTSGAYVSVEDAATDEQSLAELREADPSRISAASEEVAVTAEASKSSKPLEPALDAMQEQQQSGVSEQAPPAAAPLSKPVPLPVPQQLGKPRARAVPDQISKPPTRRLTDSATVDTSAGSRPSAVAPKLMTPETQPAYGAAAVSLDAGKSAEGLQELSTAAPQSTAATGVEEAEAATPELAAAEETAAERGAGERGSTGRPSNAPDIPKPLPKPAQPPAQRSAPALQAKKVIILCSRCCKGNVGPTYTAGIQSCSARSACEHKPSIPLYSISTHATVKLTKTCRALIRCTGHHSSGWPWLRKPGSLGRSCLRRLWHRGTVASSCSWMTACEVTLH